VAEFVAKHENQLSNILHVPQLDMRALREAYAEHKASINLEFRTKYGDKLSGMEDAERINALAQKATRYYISQVTIEVTSNETFEGAEYNEERQLYIWRVQSKAVFTKDLLKVNSLPKTPENSDNIIAEVTQGANWNESTATFDRVYFQRRAAG